jgi:hypothetical protein
MKYGNSCASAVSTGHLVRQQNLPYPHGTVRTVLERDISVRWWVLLPHSSRHLEFRGHEQAALSQRPQCLARTGPKGFCFLTGCGI